MLNVRNSIFGLLTQSKKRQEIHISFYLPLIQSTLGTFPRNMTIKGVYMGGTLTVPGSQSEDGKVQSRGDMTITTCVKCRYLKQQYVAKTSLSSELYLTVVLRDHFTSNMTLPQ